MTTICNRCGSVMKAVTQGYVCPKCDNFYMSFKPQPIQPKFEKVTWDEQELRQLIKEVVMEILGDEE